MVKCLDELRYWIDSLKQNNKNFSERDSCSIRVAQNLGNRRQEFDDISLSSIDFVNTNKSICIQLKNGQKYLLEYQRFNILKNEENYDEYIKVTLQKKGF